MYVDQLRNVVVRLKEIKPSGARRLAGLIGVPPQTVYAWSTRVTRERGAKKILLEIQEAAREDNILGPRISEWIKRTPEKTIERLP